MSTVKCNDSKVYYSNRYWNDIPVVQKYICENYTGDKRKWWIADFKQRYCQQPFEHALVIMCGNGWVERGLYDQGIARKFSAFDYLEDLLDHAREARDGRNIDYFQADANTLELEANRYDLIVNVAAMHHVQYINRMCKMLCHALKPDGVFVNTDYIGPHRNQYSLRHWSYIKKINNQLPEQFSKNPLNKPHLGTMLNVDASEAIHSELTFKMVSRYFDIVERHDTNGGIAYPILHNNYGFSKELTPEMKQWVDFLLEKDREYTISKKVPPLFSYFIAKPKKQTLLKARQVGLYQLMENQREALASKSNGIYYWQDYVKHRVDRFIRQRFQKKQV